MIIHDGAQGDESWLALRAGRVTASEFSNLVTEKWAIRKPDTGMFHTYLVRKLAERWIGKPIDDGFTSKAVEQGTLLEDEAFNWVAGIMDKEITRPAFISMENLSAGCSPDGIIGEEGLELKCAYPQTQARWLLEQGCPESHQAQVHFSMAVTGFKRWHFVGYSRRLPKVFRTIERDEKIQGIIADALAGFLGHLNAGYKRLVEINGGEPMRASQPEVERVSESYSQQTGDVTP